MPWKAWIQTLEARPQSGCSSPLPHTASLEGVQDAVGTGGIGQGRENASVCVVEVRSLHGERMESWLSDTSLVHSCLIHQMGL